MNAHERPQQSLGVSLAEAWPESAEQSPLLFRRQLGDDWLIDLNAASSPVVLAARDTDDIAPASLDLSRYNDEGRRRIKFQDEACIAMLAKKPLEASDTAVLYYVESDLRLDRIIPKPASFQSRLEAKPVTKGGELAMNDQATAIVERLFKPREEIIEELGISAKALGLNLARAVRTNRDSEREFYIAAYKQGRVTVPEELPSTQGATFTAEEQAVLERLPLPRKGGKLALGAEWNSIAKQLASIYSKLGVETPEQALFIALRDKHTD